jgi:DNA-binding IclR family transcriptional regulator
MASMAGNTSAPGASVTSRVLGILAAFDERHPRLSLSEIARRTDLPVGTAHRLVGELVEWGALGRLETGQYVIGRRLWDTGLLAPVQTDLRDAASPFLQDIYATTLATVHLAIQDGLSVLYLDRVSGNTSVPVVSKVGARLPMHATGVGKVMLAHAPEEVQAQVLARLTRVTPYTITQPGLLRRQLARVHRDGYALTVEEMSLGACSLAVPIRSREEVVASLGIVLPNLDRNRPRLVMALQVAARGIGRALDSPRVT